MNYNIKQATLSNLEEIFNLQNDYEHLLISKDSLKNDLNDKLSIYFIAIDDNNNIIGAIGGKNSVDHLDVSIVITKKEFAHKGIASSLLNKIIEYCKQKSIEKIFLEVRQSNIAAINLYTKIGFNQISIRKNYYNNNEDALIYMLEI